MKEFIFALLVAAGAASMAWWLGAGTDPLEQIQFARRYLSPSSLLRFAI